MSAAKKGLGRGFDSLIPTDLIDDSFDPNNLYDPIADEDKKVSHEQTLPLAKIVANPDQPSLLQKAMRMRLSQGNAVTEPRR